MTRSFRTVLLDEIPDQTEPETLYVSIPYATAVHRCACGCGNEVVTPLTPTDWRLIYDGNFSLSRSIGNWSFPCQSHSWLTRGEIHWSDAWDQEQIDRNRARDQEAKNRYYDQATTSPVQFEQPRKTRWAFFGKWRKNR